MSVSLVQSPPARGLPARPNLEFLKNEAKQRLRGLRATTPDARLADVQHLLAREYGFANWRDLKANVERLRAAELSPVAQATVGDWIALAPGASRVAMHLRPAADGLAVTMDACDEGLFDLAADYVSLEGEWLSFTLLMPSTKGFHQGFYQARWDARTDRWVGAWTMHGITQEVDFVRGSYPPAPRFEGLDGFWDGRLASSDRLIRLIFRLKSGDHGTFAWLDSPDTGILGRAAVSIVREGREITIAMRTVSVTGTLSEDGQWIEGAFLKGGKSRPLTLVRRPPGGAPPLPQRAPAIELPSEAMAVLAGDYLTELKTVLRVTEEDGRMYCQFIGPAVDQAPESPAAEAVRGPKLELLASSPTTVFWRILDAAAEFELGPDGRAAAMVQRQNGRAFRATRMD